MWPVFHSPTSGRLKQLALYINQFITFWPIPTKFSTKEHCSLLMMLKLRFMHVHFCKRKYCFIPISLFLLSCFCKKSYLKQSMVSFFLFTEAIIEDLQKCRETSQKICTCNREKLFYGKDPNICQEMVNASIIKLVKKKGVELSLEGMSFYPTCIYTFDACVVRVSAICS